MSPRREHESVSAIRSTHPYSAAISDRGLYIRRREKEREIVARNNAIYNAAFLLAFAVSHVDSHRGIIPFTVVTRDRGRNNVTAFSTVSTCALSVSPPLFPLSRPLLVLSSYTRLQSSIRNLHWGAKPPRRKSLPLRVIIAAIITRS